MASLLQELAAPAAYPVALATAKQWAREPSADWDQDITAALQAAVMHAESISHNHIVRRPVRERLDVFRPYLELSGYPVRGVQQIQYLDTSGVQQILDPTWYRVDIFDGQARITPEYGKFFPPTRLVINAISITYDTGLLCPVGAIDTVAGWLTVPGHNKAVGDIVQLSTDGAAVLPALLVAGTPYYVVGVSADSPSTQIQVSATAAGAAIVPATQIAGGNAFLGMLDARITMALRLMVNSWMTNPADIVVGAGAAATLPIPYAAETLLGAFAPRGF